jgi:hypothetical protein
MELTPDWNEFIECLNANEVEFMVVGAFAMGYHSLPRMTGDIDFWVRATEANSRRVWQAVQDFGMGSIGFGPLDIAQGNSLMMGVPPGRIDILSSISGVEFDEAWRRRVEGQLGGIVVAFLSEEDLLTNKLASGRTKDLADAERLLRRRGQRN